MRGNGSSVIVVSHAWPSLDNGSGFAVMALLQQCAQVFDKIQCIGLTDSPPTDVDRLFPDIRWSHIGIQRLPIPARFLLSLGSTLPAACYQFKSRETIGRVLDAMELSLDHKRVGTVVLEDLPIAIALLYAIRNRFPKVKVAIRSENVLSAIFDPLTRQGNPLSRLAWTIEVTRMRQAEIAVSGHADRMWAISENDRQGYLSRLGIKCDGVFGVSLDGDRFSSIATGDSQTVVFVGGVDLRKRLGIMNFIRYAWPVVRSEVPSARLVLAGQGSETINDPKKGIVGMGYVPDDRDVWARGQIALNPQELGSGIKLKSIIAMLSAKALVSTATGIEGIEGTDGTHFLAAANAQSLAPLIIQLMKSPSQAKEMGQKAQELACDMYSRDRLTRSVSPLLEDLKRISSAEQQRER